MCEKLKFIFN